MFAESQWGIAEIWARLCVPEPVSPLLRRQSWHRRQQFPRVRMGWLVKDLPGEASLHKPSRSHCRNARRDLCNNRQAVRDKDVGKPELAL